jgi:hypothetical protein
VRHLDVAVRLVVPRELLLLELGELRVELLELLPDLMSWCEVGSTCFAMSGAKCAIAAFVMVTRPASRSIEKLLRSAVNPNAIVSCVPEETIPRFAALQHP